MESTKTKSENYYNALIEDPKRANKILNEILEIEKNLKRKPGTEKNEN